jgi:mannitol-1-/sugar-/sorbitol-6-phosphatase
VSWQVSAQAVLFDLDGTLVDSSTVITSTWREWCERYDADLTTVLSIMPGRPGVDVMREVRPDLPDEIHTAENTAMLASEVDNATAVTAMPGADELLAALAPTQWAVVTACTHELATARLRAAGLPVPEVLVGSDSVRPGKPHPAGYLSAARQLGVPPEQAVVVEDALAGVAAGRAAGMRVVALPPAADDELIASGCLTVPALRHLRVDAGPRGVTVSVLPE